MVHGETWVVGCSSMVLRLNAIILTLVKLLLHLRNILLLSTVRRIEILS